MILPQTRTSLHPVKVSNLNELSKRGPFTNIDVNSSLLQLLML